MNSPRTSRRGAFVAPALLFVALLGGAMFFGLLAMSGKYEKDIAADRAAVTAPPSKAVPAAKTVATTRPTRNPRATTNPPGTPVPQRSASPSATPQSANATDQAHELALLPRKPIPGHTYPIPGAYCTPPGAKSHTVNGDVVVCAGSDRDQRNRWRATS